MFFYEGLSWILDSNDTSLKGEAKYQANIDFVHSLGQKCDCVGWSYLDAKQNWSEKKIFKKG